MKRLLLLGVGSALMFTMGGVGPAQADNGPHSYGGPASSGLNTVAADKCAGCHRAHTSQAALNLVQAQPQLCLNCHGTGAIGAKTDVTDGIGYSGTPDRGAASGALRGGGFDYALINAAAPKAVYVKQTDGTLKPTAQSIPPLGLTAKQATNSKHNVGGTSGDNVGGTIWGNGDLGSAGVGMTGVTLECGSCHDPHGNGNYRILKPIPSVAVVTAGVTKSTAVAALGIVVPDATEKSYTTLDYWDTASPSTGPAATGPVRTATTNTSGTTYADIFTALPGAVPLTGTPATVSGDKSDPKLATGVTDYVIPDRFISNISAWCTTCHTRYLAGSGSHSTNSKDPTFTYRHRSDANYKVGGANCITCHVAHGSNAAMTTGSQSALVGTPGSTTALGNESRLLRVDNRGMCAMCHNK